jgi:hypothetical protein
MGSFSLTAVSWEGYSRFHDVGDVGWLGTATCALHEDGVRRGQDTEIQRYRDTAIQNRDTEHLVDRGG